MTVVSAGAGYHTTTSFNVRSRETNKASASTNENNQVSQEMVINDTSFQYFYDMKKQLGSAE